MNPELALPHAAGLGSLSLKVRDLSAVEQFYTEVLGLRTLARSAGRLSLGVEGRALLHLTQDTQALPSQAHHVGLYHTAFLLPSRAELGRWLAHAIAAGLRVGSGDHLVSEAFYFNDPEGNGVEVYADRPRASWQWSGGQVQMDTVTVDISGVLSAAGITAALPSAATYQAPPALRLGHVHLKVGSARQAAEFYARALGLTLTAQMPGAAFLSWDGYHHHLGLNEWHSRGQGPRPEIAGGLLEVEIVTPQPEGARSTLALTDPWGNHVAVRGAPQAVTFS